MVEALSLARRHEWWGRWWTPDNPEAKHGGMAVFDPVDGISLRLSGGFDYQVFDEPQPGVRTYSGETRGFPIVFGAARGDLITLVDCTVSSSSGGLFDAEPTDQTLTARLLLHGCHLLDAGSAEFTALETTVENLPRWAVKSAITGRVNLPKESGEMPSAAYEVKPVEELEAEAGGDRFTLNHACTFPVIKATRTRHEALLRSEPSIRVDFSAPVPAHQALVSASRIRDLVTLAMGKACGTVTHTLFLPPDPGAYPPNHPYSTHPRPIPCLTPQAYQAKPDSDPVPNREVLFTLDDLAFSDVVPRWMAIHSRFRAASNILLGLQYNTEQYLESRTISAVAAAESFHRALDPVPPMPDAEFDELRRALIAATPKQHQSLVHDRFRRNEPSLKSRLLDLVNRLDPGVAERLLPDREAWAKMARDSRDTLAHEGAAGDRDFLELYAVAEATAAIVRLNILMELGVPSDKVIAKITENRLLSRASRLAREHLRTPAQGDPA